MLKWDDLVNKTDNDKYNVISMFDKNLPVNIDVLIVMPGEPIDISETDLDLFDVYLDSFDDLETAQNYVDMVKNNDKRTI